MITMFRPEVVTIDGKPFAVGVVRRALVALTAVHQIAEALRLSDNQRRNPITVARIAVERISTPAPAGVPVEESLHEEHGIPIYQLTAGRCTITLLDDAVEIATPESGGGMAVVEMHREQGMQALRELRSILNDPRIVALLG